MAKTSDYLISVGKTNTSMQVTTAPPTTASAGTSIPFKGKLVDAWGTGLGKVVTCMVDGYSYASMTTVGGNWSFSFSLAAGNHTAYVTFAGDASYNGSSTPTYAIAVAKIATVMTVTTPPPATATPGVAIPFAGNLKTASGIGLAGETVDLMVNGAKIGSATTGVGGSWSLPFTLTATGSYTVYANFPGTTVYAGCEEGKLPLLILGIGVVAGIAAVLRRVKWREPQTIR